MAGQKGKSRAEQAASSAKNNSAKKTTKKNPNGTNAKKTPQTPVQEKKIPTRVITSAVFLALFVLTLVIFFLPDDKDGQLVRLIGKFIQGLIGRVAFIVSIPGFLYLFLIHAFSGKRPVVMRSVCLGIFVILCGCISHLALDSGVIPGGIAAVKELYVGGIEGTAGGVICGLVAVLLRWLCGSAISYIIFIVAAIFTLLGSMQITITSIIRAIEDRPRAEWEDKEKEPRQEPAAVVVNHIANKHIQHVENKRHKEEAALVRAAEQEKKAAEKPKKSIDIMISEAPDLPPSDKVTDMLTQIEAEIERPVAAAVGPAIPMEDVEIIAPGKISDDLPKTMPPLEKEPPAAKPVTVQAVAVEKKKSKVSSAEAQASAQQVAKEIETAQEQPQAKYCFPPIDLLKNPAGSAADGTAEMRENSRRLSETLASFKIEAHIINVTRGPSVTRYEVELEKGVRLSKLTTAADDIALSLGASGVRIAAVPGKISVVGIEVPNRAVTTVSLREVIDSPEFRKAKSKSSFAVGKDIGGSCIVGNISRLPHMLIAGTTGSGKSVCMNSIIISLLYKASPDDVKLIMVDPKMVELGIYNNIPHLLIPVVTDPKKAAGSLQWAVTEMMRRYKAMSDAGVRDLESYNSIVETQEEGIKLPQVVVIIDELADLMLVAAKEVEESICRIAQMGRAAGIHLIIATQRPSADVITGLMKANIPSRIAFAVASAMESRIILDTQGAEKLVGKGDMLYAPIGNGKPKRVQGCFVSDPEVEAVASYVKSNFVTNYDQTVMEEIERKAEQTGNKPAASDPEPNSDELGGDEMLPAAVEVILDTKQASVSMLQRRLKLGYARAARIVDEMEEKGIVGPFQGSKPREILITKEQWEQMQGKPATQMAFDDLEELQEDSEEAPF